MRRRRFRTLAGCCSLALVALACSGNEPLRVKEDPGAGEDTVRIPLTDMGSRTYHGFTGGLYPNASNSLPSDHAAAGLAQAGNIRPLDTNGNVDPGGKVVMLSIGMSNTSQEFCGRNVTAGCWRGSFMDQAAADPAVDHSTLLIVNGAQGGRAAGSWTDPRNDVYDVVREERLQALGATETQVQVVWMKQANAGPRISLPDASADAYQLEANLGAIVRALAVRYPNLQQVFLSSRTYGGYATTQLNPEPYAYESGFAVKWLIQAQIEQIRSGRVTDANAGDLSYDTGVPWLAWGAYLWADGIDPRSDGLTWERADFVSDGTHPSESGVAKAGAMLLEFFKTSPHTRCWFLAGEACS